MSIRDRIATLAAAAGPMGVVEPAKPDDVEPTPASHYLHTPSAAPPPQSRVSHLAAAANVPGCWATLQCGGEREEQPGRVVSLTEPVYSIGRKEGCHLRLGGMGVAKW